MFNHAYDDMYFIVVHEQPQGTTFLFIVDDQPYLTAILVRDYVHSFIYLHVLNHIQEYFGCMMAANIVVGRNRAKLATIRRFLSDLHFYDWRGCQPKPALKSQLLH